MSSEPTRAHDRERPIRDLPLPDMTNVNLLVIALNVPVQLGFFCLPAALGLGGWIVAVSASFFTVLLSIDHIVATRNARLDARNTKIAAENDRIRQAREALQAQRERAAAAARESQARAQERRDEIARLQGELRAVRAKRQGST